jgi:PAS domain S-box-containing protein
MEPIFGIKVERMPGRTWQEIGIDKSLYLPWQQKCEEALQTCRAVEHEGQFSDAHGETNYYHAQIVPEINEQGQIETILTISQNITKRKQAQEELRESEERFQKAFHSNGAMICIVRTADDQIIKVNQRLLDVIGYTREELVGHTFQRLNLWAEDHQRAESLLGEIRDKGKPQSFEFCLRTKSGRIVTLLTSTSLLTLHGELCRISTSQDITKEKKLEAEMQRLDRLNLVGEMAASIGHEVRNPMTTVRGYLQLFQRRAELAKYGEQLTTMIEELDRANAIISEFLSLAKNKAIDRKRGNLNTIIRSLSPLIQADALRTGHETAFRTGDIPDNEFDPQQVRQLILNLTLNALEAMQAGGRLTIRTYLSNQAIVLEVKDTGPGMPDQILQQLGTPFVTTKENGTGLGLPVCFRIAERHGAKITLQSSPQGTTVRVAFNDILDIN